MSTCSANAENYKQFDCPGTMHLKEGLYVCIFGWHLWLVNRTDRTKGRLLLDAHKNYTYYTKILRKATSYNSSGVVWYG